MERFLQILKVAALVGLILVLGVLLAPTLKGPFVVVHFTTALRGWLLAQLVLLGFAFAAHLLVLRLIAIRRVAGSHRDPLASRLSASIVPLRC